MSGVLRIERPSTIAVLPRLIGRSTGRYVVSDVHGGTPGSRKRKRNELAVGADGEGVSIYDTQSSKLVNSHALPPQTFFTCPPCSLRLRNTDNNWVERRTYVSTKGPISTIMVFRDLTKPDGTTKSTVASRSLADDAAPVVLLNAISEPGKSDQEGLILIRKDGEIQYLDGLDLHTLWTSPASTIRRNTTLPEVMNHKVDFAQLTDAHTAIKKLFKGREDLRAAFSQEISADGFNPPIFIIVTSPNDPLLLADRTLHVVTLSSNIEPVSAGTTQSVNTLLSVALPWTHQKPPAQISGVQYYLHFHSGTLYELYDQNLTVFDLCDSNPKVQSQLYMEKAESFLLLSSTSILSASEETLTIYHPAFRSVQASVVLKSDIQHDTKKAKANGDIFTDSSYSCKLVSYSPKQSTAYAIAGNELLAFQIDSRQRIPGRRGALGLLMDSLGYGVGHPPMPYQKLECIPLVPSGAYPAGSDTRYESDIEKKIEEMDGYVVAQDVEGFERVMAQLLGMSRDEEELRKWQAKHLPIKQVNGVSTTNGVNIKATDTVVDAKPIPRWLWPKSRSAYPDIDPRWAEYILSRIFSWSKATNSEHPEDDSQNTLIFTFFPHNVVNWLIETGNMSPAAIQSALRRDIKISMPEKVTPGQLVQALAEVDTEFRMLFTLLSTTYLDAVELLYAIRLLMQSLELFGEQPREEQHLLTNGNVADMVDSELQKQIEIEQEKADRALILAEHRLEDYSSIRGRALSLALAKLYSSPAPSTISALRSTFSSAEIVSLIYLLRFELARGAWTSRYLDAYYGDGYGDEIGHDNTILPVSSLLNCCVDAIGAGGWLSGDAMLVDGDLYESEELVASLKLEVNAALEGVEEASYLRGLVVEMVRYGETFQAAIPSTKRKRRKGQGSKPIILPETGKDVTMLPFGLKVEQQVSRYRIGAGGEIHQRTARDIGQLKSKKVGKYSRERIVI